MNPDNRAKLAARVAKAAGEAVGARGYASAIDVFMGLGWLSSDQVTQWRTRRVPFLEAAINVNLHRISEAMSLFRAWAANAKLKPSETEYVARTPAREPLRFSKSGNPAIEKAYRTHWISPKLSEKKREKIAAKVERPPELVVIRPREDWTCHKCGGTGAFLIMEPPGPACMACVGLGALVPLPSGDARLTRKARVLSKTTAVIVYWSRSRKRYERVGSLVEPAALSQACAELGLPPPELGDDEEEGDLDQR